MSVQRTTLFLKAEERFVTNWLAHELDAMPRRVAGPTGELELMPPSDLDFLLCNLGKSEAEVRAWQLPSGDGGRNARPVLAPSPLSFRVIELARDRVEVRIRCSEPVLESYATELAGQLRQRWPGAAPSPAPTKVTEAFEPTAIKQASGCSARCTLGTYDHEKVVQTYRTLQDRLRRRPDQYEVSAELSCDKRTLQRHLGHLNMKWPPV